MTATELVRDAAPSAEVVELYRPSSPAVDFSPGQIALINRTICKPKNREATNDELALFIGQCKRTGLDPFAKQIYAVFRWDSQIGAERMGIQTGIDGFRTIAERTGHYLGQVGPFWCDDTGAWKETWFDKAAPQAAKVIVRKALGAHVSETPAVAHWAEYAVTGAGGMMWKAKPALMLAKCAEALALRKAFPNDMSGLVVDAEVDNEQHSTAPLAAASEAAADTDADTAQTITKKRAGELVDAALAVGLEEQLQLAASHAHAADVGDCSTKGAATEALRALTSEAADKVEAWIQRKADEQAATA